MSKKQAPSPATQPRTNTDVIVTSPKGRKYIASFFTYSNVESLRQKHIGTGKCLSGRYFWASDMILVTDISRETTEEVTDHLVVDGEFHSIFREMVD